MHKTATTLVNAGFDVMIIGIRKKNTPNFKRNYKTKLFKLFFYKNWLFYANYNIFLFSYLLFSDVDILLSVDLDTLLANFLVSKIRKKKLVYDSHELFTELPELVERPKIKSIWLKIEKYILPKIQRSYTVCQSIADYYSSKYNISMDVVRNVPFYNNLSNFSKSIQNKVVIYQGAINVGRGLEEMIEAMQFIDNSVLWIIGDGYLSAELKEHTKKIGVEQKVCFIGKIPVEQLPNYTIQAQLGISLEKNMGLNYYYALPNKIFDYIQACVPVLCSNLPEMKKIVEEFEIGEILISHNPLSIANQINEILNNKEKNENWKKKLKVAKKQLCWDIEQHILLKHFTE